MESDLRNFTALTQGPDPEVKERSYSSSDWVIIGLGLAASVVLAFVLFG